MENTYDLSIDMATELGTRVNEAGCGGNLSGLMKIRRELNLFLLSLNHSSSSDGVGQQIHFLFIALGHLDNMDREIRISSSNDDLVRLERIHGKIRGLKFLILNYIKHLMSEG